MSASKYFPSKTRSTTRSSGLKALSALATNHKQASRRKHVKIEYETGDKSKEKGKKRASDDQTKRKKAKPNDVNSDWIPERWKDQLNNIKTMRKDKDAPVDSMGCERTADMTASPEVLDNYHSPPHCDLHPLSPANK